MKRKILNAGVMIIFFLLVGIFQKNAYGEPVSYGTYNYYGTKDEEEVHHLSVDYTNNRIVLNKAALVNYTELNNKGLDTNLFHEKRELTALSGDGEKLQDGDILTTGCTFKFGEDTVPVYVPGEIDGDGKVNVIDMEKQQKAVLGIEVLNDTQLIAARLVSQNALSVVDMEVIQKSILGIESLEENVCPGGGIHQYVYYSGAENASCLNEVSQTQICEKCGETRTIILPIGNHEFHKIQTVQPTCTKEGYDLYECANCNASEERNQIPAKGHDEENRYTTMTQPTCTKEGATNYCCPVCHQVIESEPIPAYGHYFVYSKTIKEATVDECGIDLYQCAVCRTTEERETRKAGQLKESNIQLSVGDTYKLEVLNRDQLTYSVSYEFDAYEGIVEVSEDGVITAKGRGEATVFIQDEYDRQYEATVNIFDHVDDNYIYNILEDGNIRLIKILKGNDPSVTEYTVPAYIDGYLVEIVSSSVFNGWRNLEKVIFSEGIVTLDSYVFDEKCENLRTVVIPSTLESAFGYTGGAPIETVVLADNLKTIPDRAIACIATLKTVHLPEELEDLGSSAFALCTSLETIELPESITELGYGTFSGCTSLKSFKIPEGVTNIGEDAFKGCTALTALNIPAGVTKIGESAFEGCTALTTMNIPAGVTELGKSAFKDCSALVSIELPESLTKLEAETFKNCENLVIEHSLEGITYYGKEAFYGCENVVYDKIYEGVTKIEKDALYGCKVSDPIAVPASLKDLKGLTMVKHFILEDGRTSLQSSFFSEMGNIESVVLPETLTTLGSWVFEDCPLLKEITIPKSLTTCSGAGWGSAFEFSHIEKVTFEEGMVDIPHSIFANCVTLKEIQLPSTLKTIGMYAFNGCTALESLTIPDGTTTIGNACFAQCTSLATLSIPSSLVGAGSALGGPAFEDCGIESIEFRGNWTEIPSSMFTGVDSLKTIILPSTLKKINMYAFDDCDGLENVVLPENLEYIGDCAFADCDSLTNINIPKSVTYMGKDGTGFGGAFNGSALMNVTLEEGMIELPSFAFISCESLESITLPLTLEKIGDYAFDYCKSLNTISLPEGLQEIGVSAFANTTALTKITIPKSLKKVGWAVAGGPFEQSGLTEVTLADGVTEILEGEFMYADHLQTIHMPSTLTKIGNYAFQGCTNLTSFVIPDSVTELGYWLFYDSGVSEITVPNTVSVLGSNSMSPFEGDSIKKIILQEGITEISACEFANCSSLIEVQCPSTLKVIRNNAFNGCESLEEFVVPDGVEAIETLAFAECKSLKRLTIPASVRTIGEDMCYFLTGEYEYPTIITSKDSAAMEYAIKYGYQYIIK